MTGTSSLFEQARYIEPVSEEAAEQYAAKQAKMVNRQNEQMLALPNICNMLGDLSVEVMCDNH